MSGQRLNYVDNNLDRFFGVTIYCFLSTTSAPSDYVKYESFNTDFCYTETIGSIVYFRYPPIIMSGFIGTVSHVTFGRYEARLYSSSSYEYLKFSLPTPIEITSEQEEICLHGPGGTTDDIIFWYMDFS